MKKNIVYYMVFLSILISSDVISAPTVKVTVLVVDENGSPLNNAAVTVIFSEQKSDGDGWGTTYSKKTNVTDGVGKAVISSSGLPYIAYSATKNGYYKSSVEYEFNDSKGYYGFRYYEPYNPTLMITLKKKISPRGLYVRSLSGKKGVVIPQMNKPIGYDLVAADWVVPHGLGSYSDFIFELKGKVISRAEFDLTLTMTFSNEGDGIKKVKSLQKNNSEVRLPYHAPLSGYESEYVQSYSMMPTKVHSEFFNSSNYFYRIRTKLDEKGVVIGALYGKIHGSIKFDYSGYISFVYYLNPDSLDTNLEFDYRSRIKAEGIKGVGDK